MKKKMPFMLQLMIHLTVKARMHLRVDLRVHLKDVLSNLHKDEQEGTFEVTLKGPI